MTNIPEPETSKILKMILKDLQSYQNNPDFLKAMYKRKLMEITLKPFCKWLLPQVQAFQGPFLPSTVRDLTEQVLNQINIYDNQLAFGTGQYLYQLKFGTNPKGSGDLFDKCVEKAKYDLLDYIYYIYFPLKYNEFDEFFSRWKQFADDIKQAKDRKKFRFDNLLNSESRNYRAGQFFHSVANKKRAILAQELMSAVSHNCYDIKVLTIKNELLALEKNDYNLGLTPDPRYTVQGALTEAQKLSAESFQMMDFLKRFADESKSSINFLKEKGSNVGLLIENIDQRLVELEDEIAKSMKDLEILIEANEEYLNQEYKKKFKQHQDRSNRNRNRRNPPDKRSAKLKVRPSDQNNLKLSKNRNNPLSIRSGPNQRPVWSKNPMGKSKGGSGRPNVPPGGGQIKIHFKKHEVLYLVILTTLFIFLNGIKLFPPKTSLSLLQNNDIIKTLDWLTNEKGYLLTLTNLQDNLNKNGFLQLGKRKLKELIYEMEKIENSISPSDLESLKKYVKDYLTEKLIDQSLKNKK